MKSRVSIVVCAIVLFVFLGGASANVVIMQCDVGGCGPVQSGWTALGSCGAFTNVAGSGIDVALSTGNPGACECRNPGGTGTLDDVEADLLFANDEESSPGGDFIITFSNLTPGTSYRLLSYHNRSDEGDTTIGNVTVTGATVISVPASIVQNHAIMDNPAQTEFIAGAGDATIRFEAPAGGCNGCQVFLNGFVLEITGTVIQFDSASSTGAESSSPASLLVNISNPDPGVTYTATYMAVGGTATNGADYTLAPSMLTFPPGVTSLPINIPITNDGIDEDDETIIVELLSASGGSAVLGSLNQHTYVILDPRPGVSFEQPSSSGLESVSTVFVGVTLSAPINDTVTVHYAVTGGTATYGTDYTVATGPLVFAPYEFSKNIQITVYDDAIEEVSNETIELTIVSTSSNVKLGFENQHTYTIIDNEQGLQFDGLIWFYSEDPSNLYVNPDNRLVWDVAKGSQITTRLPEHRLSVVGDYVEFKYWWMTDGPHDCPDCFGCDPYCLDDDITCIAGTGDFRAGLFEADGEYITDDGYDISSSVFQGYKGYQWRFGPNMLAGPLRIEEWCQGYKEVHKTGQTKKKDVSFSDLMKSNDHPKLRDLPGFELPPGEWSLWTIWLERTASDTVEVGITLNDRTYIVEDDSSSGQPSKIDVFAIYMRNGRPYSTCQIEPFCTQPGADYNGDFDVDWKDLDLFGDFWMALCHQSSNHCQGRDLDQNHRVDFKDFAIFASQWGANCD